LTELGLLNYCERNECSAQSSLRAKFIGVEARQPTILGENLQEPFTISRKTFRLNTKPDGSPKQVLLLISNKNDTSKIELESPTILQRTQDILHIYSYLIEHIVERKLDVRTH